ncbi:MAG TPA: hypothetical protein VK020_13660 [Microlunatus sp.]|nr:hypothetical protein [Microlunatus sp.]
MIDTLAVVPPRPTDLDLALFGAGGSAWGALTVDLDGRLRHLRAEAGRPAVWPGRASRAASGTSGSRVCSAASRE